MDHVGVPSLDVVSRTRHWLLFLAGVLLFVLGPAAYIVQIRAKQLGTPWYLPVLASAGAALMVVSVWRRRGVVRMILLAMFAIVCGFERFTIAVAMRSPA